MKPEILQGARNSIWNVNILLLMGGLKEEKDCKTNFPDLKY